MHTNVKIVRVGADPFGRGERTVFYRDYNIRGGEDVFYLWACHWPVSYPDIPIPPDGYDAEPYQEPEPRRCVPYVLAHPEHLSNLMGIVQEVS